MYLLDVGLCVTPALDAGTLGAELVPALMVLLGTKRTLFPMGRKGQERRFVFQVRRDARTETRGVLGREREKYAMQRQQNFSWGWE